MTILTAVDQAGEAAATAREGVWCVTTGADGRIIRYPVAISSRRDKVGWLAKQLATFYGIEHQVIRRRQEQLSTAAESGQSAEAT